MSAVQRRSAVRATTTLSSSTRVLVVDDDEFQRGLTKRVLSSLGVSDVRGAANGVQALELLRGETGAGIDLIVLDLDMPEMDGMEFIRHLGAIDAGISLVIASALDNSLIRAVEKMARAYGLNPVGVVGKPVSREAFTEVMQQQHTPAAAPAPATPTPDGAPRFSLEQILEGVQRGEFEPLFQPKADLASGRVVGAEALARWRHPDLGLIAPYAFIPTLEEHRQLDRLTYLILQQSAAARRGWAELGLELSVSVNLSLTSLSDETLADRITQIARSNGVDPRHMILEITETSAMVDVGQALETLARLRMRGFGLAIDDYGTGFASMEQLTRVPFSELKIDREFVSGIRGNREARIMVESGVQTARQLGINSVAEGVECEDDWNMLRDIGCDLAQGYWISKPVANESFIEFCMRAGR